MWWCVVNINQPHTNTIEAYTTTFSIEILQHAQTILYHHFRSFVSLFPFHSTFHSSHFSLYCSRLHPFFVLVLFLSLPFIWIARALSPKFGDAFKPRGYFKIPSIYEQCLLFVHFDECFSQISVRCYSEWWRCAFSMYPSGFHQFTTYCICLKNWKFISSRMRRLQRRESKQCFPLSKANFVEADFIVGLLNNHAE